MQREPCTCYGDRAMCPACSAYTNRRRAGFEIRIEQEIRQTPPEPKPEGQRAKKPTHAVWKPVDTTEKRAALLRLLGEWIALHGRLPTDGDLRGQPWESPSGLGNLAHYTIYRVYKTMRGCWDDCYDHGLCNETQYRTRINRWDVARRTNATKGRSHQKSGWCKENEQRKERICQ